MTIRSILIVDDGEDDRYIIRRYLKKIDLSWQVFEAQNGREALDFLKDFEGNRQQYQDKFPPTLILLDINMPVMNGFQFLQEFSELRQTENYESVVLAMISSSERSEDKLKAQQYPFVKGFIEKWPETIDDLHAQITAMV